MILCDVGVLLSAMAERSPHHEPCRRLDIRDSEVTDAYLAALAIESGCEWWTTDRGFGRFPGLCWRNLAD